MIRIYLIIVVAIIASCKTSKINDVCIWEDKCEEQGIDVDSIVIPVDTTLKEIQKFVRLNVWFHGEKENYRKDLSQSIDTLVHYFSMRKIGVIIADIIVTQDLGFTMKDVSENSQLERFLFDELGVKDAYNIHVIRSGGSNILGYVWGVNQDNIDFLELDPLMNRMVISDLGLSEHRTLSHEVCHSFGCGHVNCRKNLMYRIALTESRLISEGQLDTIEFVLPKRKYLLTIIE